MQMSDQVCDTDEAQAEEGTISWRCDSESIEWGGAVADGHAVNRVQVTHGNEFRATIRREVEIVGMMTSGGNSVFFAVPVVGMMGGVVVSWYAFQ